MSSSGTDTPCHMWDFAFQNSQIAIHHVFDVPTAFYWTDAGGHTPFEVVTTDTLLNRITQWAMATTQTLAAAPPSDVNAPARDTWSSGWDDLLVKDASSGAYTFAEDFRTSKFLDEADGTGFGNLEWNGGDLAFHDVEGKRVQEATIRWKFRGLTGGESFTQIALSLKTLIPLLSSGEATLHIASNVNGPWQQVGTLCIPLLELPLVTCEQEGSVRFQTPVQTFWIQLNLSGHFGRAGDPAIRIDDFRVDAR